MLNSIFSSILNIGLKLNKPNHHNYRHKSISSVIIWAVLLTVIMTSSHTQAAPTGGMVAKGSARIAIDGTHTIISQNSLLAVIDWKSFDVGADERVEFMVPDRGTSLNQIKGAASQILGHVVSNGAIYFVNQNGFVFGSNSVITAQNLVISTQNIPTYQFLDNREIKNIIFEPPTNLSTSIRLAGEIKLADHGMVAVFAPHIGATPSSDILAPQGSVTLAGGAVDFADYGENTELKFAMRPFEQVVFVEHLGKIKAAGGQINLVVQGLKDHLNTNLVNNGTLDTSSNTNLRSKITMAAADGIAYMGPSSQINTGKNGMLIYNQSNPNFDINIDSAFLSKISYDPSMDLHFSSGRDVIVTTPLGSETSHITLHADGGIAVFAPITAHRLDFNALYIFIHDNLWVGGGGLAMISNGTAWHSHQGIAIIPPKNAEKLPLTLADKGDLTLTAYHGGTIYIGRGIIANNINLVSDGGGIGVYGGLTATNKTDLNNTSIGGNINIHQYNKGNIWLEGNIHANNINITSELGSIEILGGIITNFSNFYDRANGNVIVTAGTNTNKRKNGINFHQSILANNVTVHADKGDIIFYDTVKNGEYSRETNRLEVVTHGGIIFGTNVWMRELGILILQAGYIDHRNTMDADYADSVTYMVSDISHPDDGKRITYRFAKKVYYKNTCSSYGSCYDIH